MVLRKYAYLISICFALLSGCGSTTNENDEPETYEVVSVEQTEDASGEKEESEKQTATFLEGALTRTEIKGLEEGLRAWFLSCEDGSDPLAACMKEEGYSYSGGDSRFETLYIKDYTMYTLKQYLIYLKDTTAEGTQFQVNAYFEEYGKLVVEITKVKTDNIQAQSNEVNLFFEAERPINSIAIIHDGDEVYYYESPYFGMVYS